MKLFIVLQNITAPIVIFGGSAYIWGIYGWLNGVAFMLLAGLSYGGILWFQHAINVERHSKGMN